MRKSFLEFSRLNTEKLFQNRFNILIILLIILSSLLIARLYFLQVVSFNHFDTLSKTNRIKFISTPQGRGIIYDRNNTVLADNASLYSIEINIEKKRNLPKIIDAIKKEIGLSKEEIENFYEKKYKYSHYNSIVLKSNLNEEEVAKILSIRYKYDGLDVTASLLRKYPYKEITHHVLGHVGYIDKKDLSSLDKKKYRNMQYIGKTGVEKFYENELYGNPGYKHVEINARGRQLRDLDIGYAEPGEDIHLTIDIELQKFMFDALSKYSGSSVALNPKTGEILGMVSLPSIDPNDRLWKYGFEQEELKKLKSPTV